MSEPQASYTHDAIARGCAKLDYLALEDGDIRAYQHWVGQLAAEAARLARIRREIERCDGTTQVFRMGA